MFEKKAIRHFSRMVIILACFCATVAPLHAIETLEVELGDDGNYDGTVIITRDDEGRMTFMDNEVTTPTSLNSLLVNSTDHGGLLGLADDDHPQYINAARHLTTHNAAFNDALPIPADVNGNTTLGDHAADSAIHLDRAAAEAVSGAWTFGPLATGNLTLGSAGWIGLGAAAGRIVFNDAVTDTVDLAGADLSLSGTTRLTAAGAATLLSASIGNVAVLSSGMTKVNNTGALQLSGNTSFNIGGNLQLFGSSHATTPNQIELRQGTTSKLIITSGGAVQLNPETFLEGGIDTTGGNLAIQTANGTHVTFVAGGKSQFTTEIDANAGIEVGTLQSDAGTTVATFLNDDATFADDVSVSGDLSAGDLKLDEQSADLGAPAAGAEAFVFVKGDKFIIKFNDGGTVRYKYLDLTGTGTTWAHSTTVP